MVLEQLHSLRVALACGLLLGACVIENAESRSPRARGRGTDDRTEPAEIRRLASFQAVPVGVAVSRDDRVFLAFSRAIDETAPVSVVELVDEEPLPFPPGYLQKDGNPANERLLSVQALTVDAENRLWILDSGKVGTNLVEPRSAKLVGWHLDARVHVKTIVFPEDVAGPTAFLNDVRIDLSRGRGGMAYITDASAEGPNGLVVVDLASGTAVRRLNDHRSTRPEPRRVLEVGKQRLVQRTGPAKGEPFRLGADGIALAGDFVYYTPLVSHGLWRVPADMLADPRATDGQIAAAVEDLGDKGFAADGMLGDANGRLYVTDLEHGRIRRRDPNGKWSTIARGDELAWPDSLALKSNGDLLVTVTQIHDSKRFAGWDRRTRPFKLFHVATDSQPLFVGPAEKARTRRARRS